MERAYDLTSALHNTALQKKKQYQPHSNNIHQLYNIAFLLDKHP